MRTVVVILLAVLVGFFSGIVLSEVIYNPMVVSVGLILRVIAGSVHPYAI